MTKKIPRRMKRFQRQNDYPNENYGTNESEKKTNDYSETKLPTMKYEDVDMSEKNYEEMKKIEQMNLEEKLALLEVKKFKKQNKRLPNKEESEKMADSLYTQFKNNPEMLEEKNDYDSEKYDESENDDSRKSRRRRRRPERKTRRSKKEEYEPIQEPVITGNIKDMFETETKQNSKEFDIGLDLENDNELSNIDSKNNSNDEEIKSIEDFDNENCPNCGKQTEKIIYCSKCGTAYCKNCSKENKGKETTCPKCGTKNKI
jgi:hypothetical protein